MIYPLVASGETGVDPARPQRAREAALRGRARTRPLGVRVLTHAKVYVFAGTPIAAQQGE
jgi:hypothetical protein